MAITNPARADKPRQKVDRDEVFLEYTKSICPVCKTVIDAEVNVKDNKVFMRKRCKEHGQFEAVLYGDARDVLRLAALQQAGHDPARDPDRGRRRLPARLRPVPRPQAARLPRHHRGQHQLQPRLPDLLRGLRSPARRLLPHDGAVRAPRSTRSCAPRASRRCACTRAASRRSTPRSSSSSGMAYDKGVSTVNLNTNGIKLAHDRGFVEKLVAVRQAGRTSTCSSTASTSGRTSTSVGATCATRSRRPSTTAPSSA